MNLHRSPISLTLLLPLVLCGVLGTALVSEARLAVRPPVDDSPSPSPQHPPQATPTPDPVGDPARCRDSLRTGMQTLASTAAQVFGECAQRGFDCLLTSSAALCCAREAVACRDDLAELERVRANLRRRLQGGRCAGISYDELVREDGFDLGSIGTACSRLDPMGAPFDRAGLADCLDRLITDDVLARVVTYEVPRAAEAFDCLDLDAEEIPIVVGADPATCQPPPPTPTPVVPPPATPTPEPGASPTPSPGVDGCQPVLGGPCDNGVFTHCCVGTQHCAIVFSPSAEGFCFPGAPTPTPVPTATPNGSPSPGVTPVVTPSPAATRSPAATPSPVATASPSPTATPTGPTPTPGGPTPTPATCSSATLRVTVDYSSTEASGAIASIAYGAGVSIPGTAGESSVLARVTKLNSAQGLFNVGDNDGAPPFELTIGLVAIPGPIGAGGFADVQFDCETGTPTLSDFGCVSEVSNLLGGSIPSTCSLALTITP